MKRIESFYVVPVRLAVSVRVLLEWIVARAEPPAAGECPVVALRKCPMKDYAGKRSPFGMLDPDDWTFLEAAWANLPSFKTATRAKWLPYEEAFNLAVQTAGINAPKWRIQAKFDDTAEVSQPNRDRALQAHLCALDAKFKTSQPFGAPINNASASSMLDPDAFLSVADAQEYLELYGFALEYGRPVHFRGEALAPIYEWFSAEAKKVGRYTLEGAAEILQREAGESRIEILSKLVTAAESGQLAIFEPGRNARRELYEGANLNPSYEQAYWDDLNGWLEKAERRISYRFPDPIPASPSSIQLPLKRTEAQEAAILSAIVKKGFNALAMPKNLPGKRGTKYEIRALLKGSRLFDGVTTFDRAWERLRICGAIVDSV